jgi:AraC family transcriptional regulator
VWVAEENASLNVNAAAESYRARLRRVLDYIDTHLGEELTVERLSSVAAFSKFHFHRQFTELYGLGVFRYVQLSRLKRASYQLAFRPQIPIVEIALSSGYEGPESFARAFRKTLGQSPSEFRKQPQWAPLYASCLPLSELRSAHMKPRNCAEQVKIVEFPEIPVAVLEHRGDARRIGESIRKFVAFRRENGLPPRLSRTFNLFHDDERQTEPEAYRMDLCASIAGDVAPNSFGIVRKVIPGGRCAMLRHIGSDDTLPSTATYLYSEWLPQSGEELRDFPLFCERVTFFPDVPEHESVTDVYLPLK